MSGSPYISVKSATMNAENAPIAVHSCRVFGRVKLSAKTMRIAEFNTTRGQSP